MCGIHGAISSKTGFNKSVCDFVRQAFVANSLRGMDSSGMFQIGPIKNSVYLHKDAVNGSEFITQPAAEVLIRDVDGSYFTVCHVRAKTQGDVKAENAHPFIGWAEDDKRIIGVHNGSLHSWKHNSDAKEFEVDSAWAIQQIAEKGYKAIEDFKGAYALVYWDEESPKKINFVRNSERPMHLLFSKDKKHMLYASEAGMLAWLADRVKFDHDGKIRSLPVGKVYTFDVSGDEITWEVVTLKTPTVTTYNNNSYSRYGTTTTSTRTNYSGPMYSKSMLDLREAWTNFLKGETNAPIPLTKDAEDCGEEGGQCASDFLGWPVLQNLVPLPSELIPPAHFLKATEDEIAEAVRSDLFGCVIDVSWDGYVNNISSLMGVTECTESDQMYDCILRDVKFKNVKNLINTDTAVVIVGIETDGTLIVHRLTKRMQAYLSN